MSLNRRMSRREMIERAIGTGALVAGVAGMSDAHLLAAWEQREGAMTPTPGEVLGPFYKKGAPNIRVLRQPGDPGTPLRVVGNVWNTRGDALPFAAVDVWQADFYGLYDLEGYRYRASVRPGSDGTYAIETIMPGTYPDRPVKHIHYMVSAPGHKTLVVQAYFATDPFFEGDPVGNFDKNGIVGNRELVRPVTLYEGAGAGIAEIDFDIVLERS